MKILSLNCRGCGSLLAVRELHQLIENLGAEVVFLMETKMVKEKAQRLKLSLVFPNSQVVESEGRSGGLVLSWKRSVTVMLKINLSHTLMFP
jgi:exonuclease III